MNYNDIFRDAFSSVTPVNDNADFIKRIEETAETNKGKPEISSRAIRLTEIKVEQPVRKPVSKKKLVFASCAAAAAVLAAGIAVYPKDSITRIPVHDPAYGAGTKPDVTVAKLAERQPDETSVIMEFPDDASTAFRGEYPVISEEDEAAITHELHKFIEIADDYRYGKVYALIDRYVYDGRSIRVYYDLQFQQDVSFTEMISGYSMPTLSVTGSHSTWNIIDVRGPRVSLEAIIDPFDPTETLSVNLMYRVSEENERYEGNIRHTDNTENLIEDIFTIEPVGAECPSVTVPMEINEDRFSNTELAKEALSDVQVSPISVSFTLDHRSVLYDEISAALFSAKIENYVDPNITVVFDDGTEYNNFTGAGTHGTLDGDKTVYTADMSGYDKPMDVSRVTAVKVFYERPDTTAGMTLKEKLSQTLPETVTTTDKDGNEVKISFTECLYDGITATFKYDVEFTDPANAPYSRTLPSGEGAHFGHSVLAGTDGNISHYIGSTNFHTASKAARSIVVPHEGDGVTVNDTAFMLLPPEENMIADIPFYVNNDAEGISGLPGDIPATVTVTPLGVHIILPEDSRTSQKLNAAIEYGGDLPISLVMKDGSVINCFSKNTADYIGYDNMIDYWFHYNGEPIDVSDVASVKLFYSAEKAAEEAAPESIYSKITSPITVEKIQLFDVDDSAKSRELSAAGEPGDVEIDFTEILYDGYAARISYDLTFKDGSTDNFYKINLDGGDSSFALGGSVEYDTDSLHITDTICFEDWAAEREISVLRGDETIGRFHVGYAELEKITAETDVFGRDTLMKATVTPLTVMFTDGFDSPEDTSLKQGERYELIMKDGRTASLDYSISPDTALPVLTNGSELFDIEKIDCIKFAVDAVPARVAPVEDERSAQLEKEFTKTVGLTKEYNDVDLTAGLLKYKGDLAVTIKDYIYDGYAARINYDVEFKDGLPEDPNLFSIAFFGNGKAGGGGRNGYTVNGNTVSYTEYCHFGGKYAPSFTATVIISDIDVMSQKDEFTFELTAPEITLYEQEADELFVKNGIDNGSVTFKKVTVSPMTVTLEFINGTEEFSEQLDTNPVEITIHYNDGSSIDYDYLNGGGRTMPEMYSSYMFTRQDLLIDTENIDHVSVSYGYEE